MACWRTRSARGCPARRSRGGWWRAAHAAPPRGGDGTWIPGGAALAPARLTGRTDWGGVMWAASFTPWWNGIGWEA